MSETTVVCFFCQECSRPLKIDQSFLAINESSFESLTIPFEARKSFKEELSEPEKSKGRKKKESDIIRKSTIDIDESEIDSNQEFVLVDKKEKGFDNQNRAASKIFDLLSSLSAIDHPLCVECADSLKDRLLSKETEIKLEREQYNQYLEDHSFKEVDGGEIERLNQEIRSLEEKDAFLIEELQRIEKEREDLKESIEELEKEDQEILKREEEYWEKFNDYQLELEDSVNERETIINKFNHTVEQLEKLRSTNPFNEVFKIWHEGQFGTINGLKLGKLPNTNVDWSEINAAWGQCAFLLYTLAKKLNFEFKNYTIVPKGNFSCLISKAEDKKKLDLYDGDRFFRLSSGFNDAMVAFLDCMKQIIEFVEIKDRNFLIPHKIEGGKVGHCSIQYRAGNEEEWTKALKNMLTDLKWLLTWTAKNS